jgi:DNA-binding IclR family transcriptional regulator
LKERTSVVAHPDGKLFELLADEPCHDLLRILLREREGLTQKQLVAIAGLNSSTISRRMRELEEAGFVARRSVHGRYEVVFPTETRAVLLAAAKLTQVTLQRKLDVASLHVEELRVEDGA